MSNVNVPSVASGFDHLKNPDRSTRMFGSPPRREAPLVTPELEATRQLNLAETLPAIRAALVQVNSLQGSQRSYSKMELLKIVDDVEAALRRGEFDRTEQSLAVVTNTAHFREALLRVVTRERVLASSREAVPHTRENPAVSRADFFKDQRIPLEVRLSRVDNFAELDAALEGNKGITGSRYYSPREVDLMIKGVRDALSIGDPRWVAKAVRAITSGAGLSQVVGKLARASFIPNAKQ